jgi:hypothetical protein
MSTRLAIPIRGINRGLPVVSTPLEYTSSMNNVRAKDVLEGRMRIGQRPGLAKWSTTQIGGASQPVVFICTVSSVVS